MKKLTIIAVRYYLPSETFFSKIEFLEKEFETFFDQVATVFIDLNTAKDKDTHGRGILSDGTWFDMSGHKTSIEYQEHSDAFLYLNDTLYTKHHASLVIANIKNCVSTLSLAQFPMAVGSINPSTDAMFNEGKQMSSKHLSTFCFMLNQPANEIFKTILISLPLESQGKNWIEGRYTKYPALNKILYLHIFGPQNPWSWIAHMDQITSEYKIRKAICVAVEHMLSANIIINDGLVLPTNYGAHYKLRRIFRSFFNKLKIQK